MASTDYSRYLRKSEEKIKGLQRTLSRSVKGSRNFTRLSFGSAKLHHISNQREGYQKQVIPALYMDSDVIVKEKLRVSNMRKNHCTAKST